MDETSRQKRSGFVSGLSETGRIGWGRSLSLAITVALALAGLSLLAFLEPIQDAFLTVVTGFDEEGFVSNPKWLNRPIVTVAFMLLLYALLRVVFDRVAVQSLESWIIFGAGAKDVRWLMLIAAFIGIPALFSTFAYAATHPGFSTNYYGEDQVFETASAAMLLAGGALMILAAWRIRRIDLPLRLWAAAAIALAGAALLFLGLEEVSYGQRIFGWRTPQALQNANLQGETNLHNYWTHRTQGTIIWIAAAIILAGTSAAAILRRFWRHPGAAFLPDQALLPYAAVMTVLASHAGFHELLEQVFALFAMILGYQIAASAYRKV